MEKIGIFGGTFNPVHNGHVKLAQHYIEALSLDRLLVIPTKQPPHKTAPDLLGASLRLKLCEMAFSGIKQAQISDMEIRREGKSYTVDTVRELREKFADAERYLLVGSDMFLSFTQWKNWQEILKEVTLCTAARDRGELDKLNICKQQLSLYAKVLVFDFPPLPMSSTQIRAKIKSGEDCTDFLPKSVYMTIQKENLYREHKAMENPENQKYVEIIRPMLKQKRFEHSLNVAQQAVFLAHIHGEDEQKAYIAGILHDICKNMSQNEQLQWLEKSAIILDNSLRLQPPVWHGFAAAEYIRQVLKIEDEDIINAVRYHTVARAKMSRLEQIIYLADLTSKERDYPDVEKMRRLSECSLREGMKEALVFAVKNQAEKRLPLCRDTVLAYNEYLNDETDSQIFKEQR